MDEGELRLVREFVNTRNIEAGADALMTLDDLARWLRERALLGPDEVVTAGDLADAVRIREAIRDLLEVNHDRSSGAPAQVAAAALTDAAARCELRVQFTPDSGWRLATAYDGASGGLGRLLVIVTEAMSAGAWRRLKVCRNEGCRWAFFDTSRAGAGKWCSMAVCGNRQKARAWRTRQRQAAP